MSPSAAAQPSRTKHANDPGATDEQQRGAVQGFAPVDAAVAQRIYYGLPCANCGTYYGADQSVCPICSCPERVSPAVVPTPSVSQSTDPIPDMTQLDEERERFLQEFRAQLVAKHSESDAAESFGCTLEDNHGDAFEAATVCKTCYEVAQQKADLLEAALHIDLKDAAQIIYDAVWSDPSDPSKTYQNAAQALLTELRKRAGINMVLTTLQPYTH
ncbi:MAG TPA: hypothetical protein VFI95_15115 [Terriglobales bacterium]|nr:hypothetical protein [Terriglobales bacterium]